MNLENHINFVEKGGIPDKTFGKSIVLRIVPRARFGFVKPIQSGLRKIQNLIKSRPSRLKTGLAGRENGVRFHKEE